MSNWGYIAYKKIWQDFSLDKILATIASKTKIAFDLSKTSFLMAFSHLLCPSSKLCVYNNQSRYTNLSPAGLNDIYRSLDILADSKEKIEKEISDINRNLFNLAVDAVFYDVTTFSFSSVLPDGLKDFGYSKAGRPNKVQIVTGLSIDCYGRPTGYEIFPGNTFDGKILPAAPDSLEKRFGIRKVVIVADRGIASKVNLKEIKDKGYSYIFAYRLKSASDKIKEQVSSGGYSQIQDGDEPLRYKVISLDDRKIIITYSEAGKDSIDRDRAVEKAKSLLEDFSKIKASNRRGARKYIKQESLRYKLFFR